MMIRNALRISLLLAFTSNVWADEETNTIVDSDQLDLITFEGFSGEGELPQEWVDEDGMIDWTYPAAELEDMSSRGEIDPEEVKQWLLIFRRNIDWEEFEAWIVELEDQPGFEWTDSTDWQRIRDTSDQMLNWSSVSEGIDARLDEITSERFAMWLQRNEARINWNEFDAWAESVEDEEDYEWLTQAIELYESGEYESRVTDRNAWRQREEGGRSDAQKLDNLMSTYDVQRDGDRRRRAREGREDRLGGIALVVLSLLVISLVITLVCMHRRHKKALKAAREIVTTGEPMPEGHPDIQIDSPHRAPEVQAPQYDPDNIRKMNEME